MASRFSKKTSSIWKIDSGMLPKKSQKTYFHEQLSPWITTTKEEFSLLDNYNLQQQPEEVQLEEEEVEQQNQPIQSKRCWVVRRPLSLAFSNTLPFVSTQQTWATAIIIFHPKCKDQVKVYSSSTT